MLPLVFWKWCSSFLHLFLLQLWNSAKNLFFNIELFSLMVIQDEIFILIFRQTKLLQCEQTIFAEFQSWSRKRANMNCTTFKRPEEVLFLRQKASLMIKLYRCGSPRWLDLWKLRNWFCQDNIHVARVIIKRLNKLLSCNYGHFFE